MLTIEDLRNPERKSGFNNVTAAFDPRPGRNNPKPYQARKGGPSKIPNRGGGMRLWSGPRRVSAKEAAQDYCDYVNGNNLEVISDTLNFPGHEGSREPLPRNEEVEQALGVLRDHKAQQEGKTGYVYMIGVEHDPYAVKVGYSTNPKARVKEHQTGNPRTLILIGYFEGTKEDEKKIQLAHIEDNLTGEWFRPSVSLFEEFGLILEECDEGLVYA